MKVTQVSIIPSEQAAAANRPALTPELLAATGARYSRNNEGLESILANIDFGNKKETMQRICQVLEEHKATIENSDKSTVSEISPVAIEELIKIIDEEREAKLDKGVDAIFKMVDYGHASIADMAPVALFIDDLSIFAAYYIWSISPTAGGQESSTRYIKISQDGLIDPNLLGIPAEKQEDWKANMSQAFSLYQASLKHWQEIAEAQPEITKIPKSLLDSTDEKDKKKVDRMLRNYAFDRARVYLPVAASTNMMMVQSARSWASLASHLQSTPWPELNALGAHIASEMALATPRLLKHTQASDSTRNVLRDEFESWQQLAKDFEYHVLPDDFEPGSKFSISPKPALDIMIPDVDTCSIINAMKHRTNRYSLVGSAMARSFVAFSWDAIAMAEIRDFNRHRTGTKQCPLAPLGFYGAMDQLMGVSDSQRDSFGEREEFGYDIGKLARKMLIDGDVSYIYWTLLGTQYIFEHSTTADKFIYEMELRTGVGAHYRYAKHCHDMLDEFYQQMPELRGLVFEGSAEPE